MWGSFESEAYLKFLELASQKYAEKVSKKDLECDKPQATPSHPVKSHIVKACYPGAPKGGKLIRFGQQGVKGSPKKEGESEAYRARREDFKARHAANIAKGKSSAAYWSNLWKWVEQPELGNTD